MLKTFLSQALGTSNLLAPQTLGAARSILAFSMLKNASRQEILKLQDDLFHEMLRHVYLHSPFYHDYYSFHGIKEKDLNDISCQDLPFTDKQMITENLDQVFTDFELNKDEIEEWLKVDHNPYHLYKKKFFIVQSSGSSGESSILAYHKNELHYASLLSGMRIQSSRRKMDFMPKIAFCAATHHHFTGATLFANMSRFIGQVKLISITDATEKMVEELNHFQPDILAGYPSTILILAEAMRNKKLHIKLKQVITGGELLTEKIAESIKSEFSLEPMDSYTVTEMLSAGFRMQAKHNMTFFDDLNLLEIIDRRNNDVHVSDGEAGGAVITNLFNKTTPLIRYKLNDSIKIIPDEHSAVNSNQFTQVQFFGTRDSMDSLPILTNSGDKDYIHPHTLIEFFHKGIQRLQFLSDGTNAVTIFYEAKANLDTVIREDFYKILAQHGKFDNTKVCVQKVDVIPPEKNGKVKLVKTIRKDNT